MLEIGTSRKTLLRKYGITIFACVLVLNCISTANACFKDAADLHAELENYPQAIARYEQVADQSLTSALTKYSVKEYWLRASLCALALGVSHIWKIFRASGSICLGHRHGEAKYAEVLQSGRHI